MRIPRRSSSYTASTYAAVDQPHGAHGRGKVVCDEPLQELCTPPRRSVAGLLLRGVDCDPLGFYPHPGSDGCEGDIILSRAMRQSGRGQKWEVLGGDVLLYQPSKALHHKGSEGQTSNHTF